MPRSSLRALGAVLALVSVTFLAPPTSSVEEVWPERPGVFTLEPTLHAWSVADCGYTSPMKNECEAYPSHSCAALCYPDAVGGFGYTGRVSSYIYGKNSRGQDVYIARSCGFLASSQTQVGPVSSGGCQNFATAETMCVEGVCDYYVLWPPFKLRGESARGPQGVGPVGSWSVRLLAN